MIVAFVASKSDNRMTALNPDQILEVCVYGPNPYGDAESYAKDHVLDTDNNAYVYRVNIESVRGFKVEKAVVSFVTP